MNTQNMNGEFEGAWEKSWTAAQNAVSAQDDRALEAVAKRIAELRHIRDQMAAFRQRIRSLEPSLDPVTRPTKAPLTREILIEVTAGAIKQNLLTVTRALKQGKLSVGEELAIESLPSGRKFRTVVLGTGNKLQERGEIARFYRDAGVQPGGYVVLREVAPGQWQLSKSDKEPERYD